MPCSTRVRTMPWVVDGASSRRAASSDRLIRRAPWRALSTRIARSTDWITSVLPLWALHEDPCLLVNHRCSLQILFDDVESSSDNCEGARPMLDETNFFHRLGAEVIGTAFLVFIGVVSVPVTLIVNGNAPFTMADLGVISLAFGTVVIATVYALGHVGGNHINPAVTLGLAVSGKFPWSQVPAYIGAQVVGAIIGAAAIIGVLGQKASDVGLGVASYGDISWVRAFTAEVVGQCLLV